jgi:hypothetical protein
MVPDKIDLVDPHGISNYWCEVIEHLMIFHDTFFIWLPKATKRRTQL